MAKETKKGRKLIIIIAVIIAVLAAVYFLFAKNYIKRHFSEVSVDLAAVTDVEKTDIGENVLTVYFTRVGNSDFDDDVDAVASASLMKDGDTLIGNSELAAKVITSSVGGDIYAITTEKKYPSTYSATVSEANDELKNDEKVALTGELPDTESYDTVVLVYPLWWGTIPKAVESFVEDVDISGKKVYVVTCHGGNGKGQGVDDLEKASGAKVSEPVLELYDRDTAVSADEIINWLKGIK